MSLIISGPATGDTSFLQEQVDELRGDVDALEARPVAFTKPVTSPSLLVQILHDNNWIPAGVRCVDTLDQLTEPDRILTPIPGVTEVSFGVEFTGVIYLS